MEYRKLSAAPNNLCQYCVGASEVVDNCDRGICFYCHQLGVMRYHCRRFDKPLDAAIHPYGAPYHDFECDGPFGLGGKKRG